MENTGKEKKQIPASQKLVRECLLTSLLLLMQKKDFEDISITVLTEKAGVSRMSFYRNYQSKEEILTDACQNLMNELIEEMNKTSFDIREFFVNLFTLFRDNQLLFASVQKAGLGEAFQNHFLKNAQNLLEQLLGKPINTPLSYYSFSYRMGGLFQTLRTWIQGGFRESPEKMADILCQLFGTLEDAAATVGLVAGFNCSPGENRSGHTGTPGR